MYTIPRLRRLSWWPVSAWLIASAIVARPAAAVQPLVTGDVPTADKGHAEVHAGMGYQETDSIERQLPFTEIVYGLTAQRTFAWFTGLVNAGYTITDQRDVLFLAFAQEYRVGSRLALLSELYWRNGAGPGEKDRFAGNVGFKYHVARRLDVHAAVGKSLRSANRGGPVRRSYAGIKLEL